MLARRNSWDWASLLPELTALENVAVAAMLGWILPVLDDGARLCGTLGIGKLTPYEFSAEEKERLIDTARGIAARLLPAG